MIRFCGVVGRPDWAAQRVDAMLSLQGGSGGREASRLASPTDVACDTLMLGCVGEAAPAWGSSPSRVGLFSNDRTGSVTAFQGFLLNATSLLARFRSAGLQISDRSQAALVGHAIEAWGTTALELFEGSFAIAHYAQQQRELLLARDVFGLTPLYWTRTALGMAFGTTMHSVLASDIASGDLSAQGLACYFAYGTCVDPLTLHKDVHAIPAGSFQRFSTNRDGNAPVLRSYVPTRLRTEVAASTTSATSSGGTPPEQLIPRGTAASVWMTGEKQCANWVRSLVTLGYDVTGIVLECEDIPGNYLSSNAESLAAANGVCISRLTVGSDWALSQWREYHRFSDHPSVGGFGLSLAAGCCTENARAVMATAAGLPFAESMALKRRFAGMQGWLATAVERLPMVGARAAESLMPGWCWQTSYAVQTWNQTRNFAASMAQRRRIMTDDDIRRLGLMTDDTDGVARRFLPKGYGEGVAVPESLTLIAGPSRDPCLAAAIRDASSVSAQATTEIVLPWLPLSETFTAPVPAANAIITEEMLNVASLDTAILPMSTLLSGVLTSEATAAVDILSLSPLLDTHGVRTLWAKFCNDDSFLAARLAFVALGLHLESLRVR
jgi:hypothetical protein